MDSNKAIFLSVLISLTLGLGAFQNCAKPLETDPVADSGDVGSNGNNTGSNTTNLSITDITDDLTLDAGATALLQVIVDGENYTIQWFHNDVSIDGATSDSLEIIGLNLEDSGTYRVEVTAGNDFASETVELTVNGDGELMISESGTYNFGNVNTGQNEQHTFTVTHSGEIAASGVAVGGLAGAFSVVSTTCGASIAVGATCNIVARFAPSAAGAVSDTLTVTYTIDGQNRTAARAVSGTGVAPPQNPISVVINGGADINGVITFFSINGQAVQLSTTVSNGPAATYQWQVSPNNNAGSFSNVNGATSANYTAPAVSNYYRVVVTGPGGPATSPSVFVNAIVIPVF